LHADSFNRKLGDYVTFLLAFRSDDRKDQNTKRLRLAGIQIHDPMSLDYKQINESSHSDRIWNFLFYLMVFFIGILQSTHNWKKLINLCPKAKI
jgi:hypothetical protein